MSRTWYYSDSNRTRAAANPPALQSANLGRRLLSIGAIILLYTAAVPFTPVSWIIGDIEGAFLIDRFVAGIALLCALYFQFTLAGLTHPVVIALPNPASSSTHISNGRMGNKRDAEFAFIYHPDMYYTYVGIEIVALIVAECGHMEYIRRVIVLVVLAGLWAVGWVITPPGTKQWAWGHIKSIWFFIVLDVVGSVLREGRRSRR